MAEHISSDPKVHTIKITEHEAYSIMRAFGNSRHVWMNDDSLKKKYGDLEKFFHNLAHHA